MPSLLTSITMPPITHFHHYVPHYSPPSLCPHYSPPSLCPPLLTSITMPPITHLHHYVPPPPNYSPPSLYPPLLTSITMPPSPHYSPPSLCPPLLTSITMPPITHLHHYVPHYSPPSLCPPLLTSISMSPISNLHHYVEKLTCSPLQKFRYETLSPLCTQQLVVVVFTHTETSTQAGSPSRDKINILNETYITSKSQRGCCHTQWSWSKLLHPDNHCNKSSTSPSFDSSN